MITFRRSFGLNQSFLICYRCVSLGYHPSEEWLLKIILSFYFFRLCCLVVAVYSICWKHFNHITLEGIRNSLIRQEDSIIFSLLERAQYCFNVDTYDPNAFFMDGFHGSVDFMVKETEKLHARVGR
ncbi:chorismate mutase 1, chloroplastic-like [Camellia sinensis]|uniref:chorismate mutase 1, chloroplastic-like n=1 Tax=Camellia sinensis TaxID=4442 RepID=UPI001035D522|nr:chorismate mutase 1, chloroplastic-like [Camellia sinensis]